MKITDEAVEAGTAAHLLGHDSQEADPVMAYLKAHFRPDNAADLLAAAQPLMAIAWDEGWYVHDHYASNRYQGLQRPENPYR